MHGYIPYMGKHINVAKLKADAIKCGNSEAVSDFEELESRYFDNPLQFFLPHGVSWRNKEKVYGDGVVTLPASEYPKEYKNDGVAFINDWTNEIVMLVSGRKFGKTFLGASKVGFFACKTDPSWHCFKHHRIKQPEWTGPKIVIIASFSWTNVADLWSVYREVLPRDELGKFAPGGKSITFGDGRSKSIILEKSGSKLIFLCYTQPQAAWESFKANALHADEQIPKEKLLAWEDGTRTMGDYTPVFFTLSGFMLPERPDTGAGGFINRDLIGGANTRGRSVGRYNLDAESTPDEIVSNKKKKELYDKYVNPKINRSEKDSRSAVARYYPGFEQTAGLVFDEWKREYHVINPLWEDDKTPKDCTKWRIVDFAEWTGSGVMCCSWIAVFRDFAVCYRTMYERGLRVSQAAKQIIEMSHNVQVKVDSFEDDQGDLLSYYEERQEKEQFYSTLLDSRSAPIDKGNTTLQQLFSRFGLEVVPSCGQKDMIQIPRLKEWLNIDFSRTHISRRDKEGKKTKGAPRLYFFDGKCRDVVSEIEGLRRNENEQIEAVIDKKDPHHAVDTLKWWASDNPKYWGDDDIGQEKYQQQFEEATPYTGY